MLKHALLAITIAVLWAANTARAADLENTLYMQLESGRVVMDGPADELRQNPDVKEFYLGVTEEGRKSFRDVRSYRRRKRWLA